MQAQVTSFWWPSLPKSMTELLSWTWEEVCKRWCCTWASRMDHGPSDPQMVHEFLALRSNTLVISAHEWMYWLQRCSLKHRSLFVVSLCRPHNHFKAVHIATWHDWFDGSTLCSRHATRMGLATCWIGPGADHKSIVTKMGSRFDEAFRREMWSCEDQRYIVDVLSMVKNQSNLFSSFFLWPNRTFVLTQVLCVHEIGMA